MILYCKKCLRPVHKIDEKMSDGQTVVKKCPNKDCGALNSYFLRYRAVSHIVRESLSRF